MKIQFHIRSVNMTATGRDGLRKSLERLQRFVPISAAEVVLEQRWDGAPAFRTFVLLAVPGPDIQAEARDNTLAVAWLRVMAALRRQIQQREPKQLARITAARQRPIFIAPWLSQGIPTLISLKTIRRIAILVVGSTVLAIGVALLVLPGPAFIVIPAGLAFLAMEFVGARRLLRKAGKLLPNENGAPGFTASLVRHTKNFLEWASVRPQQGEQERKRTKKQQHETEKQRESTVTN
jgi:ribosome-associated translation inhibitor RaiA